MVAEVAEEDAMVLGAKAIDGRLRALQALDVTFRGFQEARECTQDLQSDGLLDRAKVGLG